jgi:hypothetical protein
MKQRPPRSLPRQPNEKRYDETPGAPPAGRLVPSEAETPLFAQLNFDSKRDYTIKDGRAIAT